jgi:hypothetical protein
MLERRGQWFADLLRKTGGWKVGAEYRAVDPATRGFIRHLTGEGRIFRIESHSSTR